MQAKIPEVGDRVCCTIDGADVWLTVKGVKVELMVSSDGIGLPRLIPLDIVKAIQSPTGLLHSTR